MGENSSSASSDQTTASSEPSNGFICTVCFKIFPTGQALGGHQNAHLFERAFRQATPNILGAVFNHHHDPRTLSSNLIAASNAGNRNGRGIKRPEEGPTNQSVPKTGSFHHYHPYERTEEFRRYRLTKNFIGEWKPAREVKATEAMERSDENDGGIDLELSLKRSESLDLELKLGF